MKIVHGEETYVYRIRQYPTKVYSNDQKYYNSDCVRPQSKIT